MAVDNGMWWSVWWPWMLVWTATAVSLIAALIWLAARVHRYRRRLRPGREKPTEGICLYLHDRAIMNLYEMGRYEKALEREVQQRITRTADGSLRARLFGVGVSGGRNVSREEISMYIESAKPITAIGLIVDTLERADAIVHGDLRTGSITWNHALARALDTVDRPGPGVRTASGCATSRTSSPSGAGSARPGRPPRAPSSSPRTATRRTRPRGHRSGSYAPRTGCATTTAMRARSRRAAWARCGTGTRGRVS
ncbi:hypothetical protein ACFQ2Y_39880 [Streptomyces malaysiensis subsp. malaysiensis]